jgi:hypothetical protein
MALFLQVLKQRFCAALPFTVGRQNSAQYREERYNE